MADDPNQAEPESAASELIEPDWTKNVETEQRSGMRSEISNAMVGLKKRFYGKGPTKAKTYINDNYVLCVLQGGLTKNEETLLEAGEDMLVRQYRLRFQEVMAAPTTEAVEQITGQKVINYHSQITFRPDYAFEIFVLDGSPE
ncbi:MAG TPA: DUF2294 domain-containing protein [Thermoleophilaceae bacterium]|nr:DUF2294 domain-containing protein [Thermoleophilaceae bacterium]